MSINDNGIIEALKENPQNGFRMLMAKYQENVYWHIRRLVVSHDDAQDASQETFVRIYRSNSCRIPASVAMIYSLISGCSWA